jgi:hypothetical protein
MALMSQILCYKKFHMKKFKSRHLLTKTKVKEDPKPAETAEPTEAATTTEGG